MIFTGPTKDGTDWAGESKIEITFDSKDELEKNFDKYLKSSRAVVRTSSEARPGDSKQLVFVLPNGQSFEIQADVEKVKEQGEKPYSISLFKLVDFSAEHKQLVMDALSEDKADIDISDSDLTIDLGGLEDDLPTSLPTPEAKPSPSTSTPSKAKAEKKPKPAAPAERSEEDRAAVAAMLAEDSPDDEDLIEAELPEELKGVSGDLIMPKKEGMSAEDDPYLEQKKYVVAYILAFTKSVQRSGYYADSNHPEAVKAKKGLYALLRKIIGKRREVNFIRKAIGDEKDVLVDGVLDEMLGLREIMPHGMAELYIPRFLEYLERRCLISLSIKRGINEDKFNRFIDLLSMYSPEFREDSRKEGERFTKTLVESGIFEISAIFDEDIISSGRKLPWQAELTLSRLKKDLKTVPLLKNATEDELAKIKIRIFSDTIKPLRNPSFMIAVLLNADLIMDAIEGSTVTKDIDVEQFMIRGADMKFLAETSYVLLKELDGVRELQRKAPLEVQRQKASEQEKVLVRIFKHIADRFLEEKDPNADEALEVFFGHKMIAFQTLPVRIQERITNKKLMEAFLEHADEILERFDSHLGDRDFSEFLNRFQRVVPLLSEKKEFLLVGRIIDAARKHLDDRDVRRKSKTRRLFDYIASTNVLDQLREAFESDDKDLRALATGVFVTFGSKSVPMLLTLLKDHDDKWVRKQLIRAITDIGPNGVPYLITELYREGNPWYFLRNVINILSVVGDKKVVGKLTLLLYHENSSVREETINALVKLAPDVAETHLIKALDDQEAKVREKAIFGLGNLKSHNDRVMRFYMDVLEGRGENNDDSMRVQVIRAVGNLDDLDEPRRKAIENLLVELLETVYGGGWKTLFKKSTGAISVSDGVKLAVCTTLGKIGSGRRVKGVLNRAQKEKDPILSQRAKEALDEISVRHP